MSETGAGRPVLRVEPTTAALALHGLPARRQPSIPASDALAALHAALAEALRERAFPIEQRAFRPHVTLSRRGVRSARHATPAQISWGVDHLALVGSVTGGDASTYTEIVRWPLRDAHG